MASGDLFEFWQKKWIVVTTNIGWGQKKEPNSDAVVGPCPMGAGLAKSLAERAADIPTYYAHVCYHCKQKTPTIWHPRGFILFPTKALNVEKPHLSWKAKSNIVLVERSLRELQALRIPDRAELAEYATAPSMDNDEILVPLVGCLNGKLLEKNVLPLMQSILDDRFVLVRHAATKPLSAVTTEHDF